MDMADPSTSTTSKYFTPQGNTNKRAFIDVSPKSPELNLNNMSELLDNKLQPLKNEITELKNAVSVANEKLDKVPTLELQVRDLQEELQKSKAECTKLHQKVISLEYYTRRNNLKFIGIPEGDTPMITGINTCEKKILEVVKDLVQLDERDIVRAHRLGYHNKDDRTPRPILVCFQHYKDKIKITSAKRALKEKHGIKVVEDLPSETAANRRDLLPVFFAAKNATEEYKEKLVQDNLYILGNKFTVDNLDELPEPLKPKNIFTEQSRDVTAFYTKWSPLSNHYPCTFTLESKIYKSVEQYYFEQKALFFGDTETACEVMKSSDPVTAKHLGYRVRGFDKEQWNSNRIMFMKTAVEAKFMQNQTLKEFLINTGTRSICEASSDRFWGCGYKLGSYEVWDMKKWHSNTLGKILAEVRDKCMEL